MARKMTRIALPDGKMLVGLADWDEQSADEMIKQIRRYAADMRAKVEEIEQSADADFQIDIVRGLHCPRHVSVVQQSARTLATEGNS
ncbi:MAG: hypothetical protein JWN66_4939 [Sphingomonas bacterium]|uniref:hypothetical protein n=1 Tax=Sphingomonas bacterium TaxID=1895847 RepID=UPI00262D00D0|nr:hypothetical protein [Sphingomonas bacterium]MDB5707823.1 hypothetical protein [Sphingomonas bacterium]